MIGLFAEALSDSNGQLFCSPGDFWSTQYAIHERGDLWFGSCGGGY